jgi:tRNA threonylcarbamoyladenosine biosynthesis protein TsaE
MCEGGVIALRGGLGAGKTCFVKGIARFLNVQEEVTSPTYTIISEYEGTMPLHHIDAYRLNSDEDFENSVGAELLYSKGITAIEWSERIEKSLPDNTVTVQIDILEGENRLITISGMELPPL